MVGFISGNIHGSGHTVGFISGNIHGSGHTVGFISGNIHGSGHIGVLSLAIYMEQVLIVVLLHIHGSDHIVVLLYIHG